jgi:large subunit ribosomal protein L16
MLFPKKVKHRKWQMQRVNPAKKRVSTRGTEISFGSHALKAQTSARITSNQIEAARKTMIRHLTKIGKVWIRIFPDRPITQKAAEMGMGKGKGDLKGYCFEVLPGRVIFEVDGVSDEVAREALRKAGTKLPIKSNVIGRNDEPRV